MPLNHRGYGAYISHNGKEVDVHKAKVERDKVTMSGYIVSEAGMVRVVMACFGTRVPIAMIRSSRCIGSNPGHPPTSLSRSGWTVVG